MIDGGGRPPDRPRMGPVVGNRAETHVVRTILFDDKDGMPDGVPGQFVMVWIPGVDEVPMSLTVTGRRKAFAVHNKGEATAALHAVKEGDLIGVRGPYGRGFDISGAGRVLAVAGGTGIAPLAPLVETGPNPKAFTVVAGAQTAKDLLYIERMRATGCELVVTTDDGTEGRKDFATAPAIELLDGGGFDLVVTCGPEIMMRVMAEACTDKGVPCQCSTERYMKCGIGICDSCSIDGLQVCRDGPVLPGDVLLNAPEFGRWRRGASGRREPLP